MLKKRKDIGVEVKVDSSVTITAYCSECGEDLDISWNKPIYGKIDDNIEIKVKPHKC